jgi:hypothetical protein
MGSMVVGDHHIVGIISFPSKNDAPLIVDPNGIEAMQFSAQDFQMVSGRIAEIFE